MRPILLLPAAALCLLLAGCALPWHQTRSDATPLDQAEAKCEFEAVRGTAAIRNGMEAGFMMGQIRRSCMLAEGWRR